jgi:hypothetical protein
MGIDRAVSRTARKQHICEWCHQPITVGTNYLEVTVLEGNADSIGTYRYHHGCTGGKP